jgi:beta-carotene 3-hydroxylase
MSVLIFFVTFFAMEFVAWFTHKYVMHGLLWNLHEDHHDKSSAHSIFERNDAFFLIFATPSIICILLGSIQGIPWVMAIGIGIAAYGMSYFFVHDIFIHQRVKWFRRTDNVYFRAIRKAHKVHHKHLGKEDGECFGMLLVPWKYFKAELKNS